MCTNRCDEKFLPLNNWKGRGPEDLELKGGEEHLAEAYNRVYSDKWKPPIGKIECRIQKCVNTYKKKLWERTVYLEHVTAVSLFNKYHKTN